MNLIYLPILLTLGAGLLVVSVCWTAWWFLVRPSHTASASKTSSRCGTPMMSTSSRHVQLTRTMTPCPFLDTHIDFNHPWGNFSDPGPKSTLTPACPTPSFSKTCPSHKPLSKCVTRARSLENVSVCTPPPTGSRSLTGIPSPSTHESPLGDPSKFYVSQSFGSLQWHSHPNLHLLVRSNLSPYSSDDDTDACGTDSESDGCSPTYRRESLCGY